MKLKFAVVVFLSAALIGCGQDKKTPTQKEAAVKQWNQARASVLGSLAKSQYESGSFDKSQKTVAEALRLDPDNANLHVLSARMHIEQGQLEPADKELVLARTLDPKSAEAEYFSGVVYQRWQKAEQAYQFYTRASEKNPSELGYVLARAEMLVAMNREPEALSLLKGKLEFFEHSPALHHAIGQLLVAQGRYADAVAAMRQATMLSTEDSGIREHLAMAYFYNHEYSQASDVFRRLVKEPANASRAELWIALGECELQSNHAGDARASFEKATELDSASTMAWLSLAKAALQLGDVRRADIVLFKVMSLDPNLSEAHLMLGYVRIKQNKLTEALLEFRKSSSLDRTDSVSVCMIGYVLEKSGKPGEAVKYYAQALKLKPNDELASRLMASIDASN